MKQHITVKQLYELSDKGRGKLDKWCTEKKYDFLTLSIGQMIEFLGDKWDISIWKRDGSMAKNDELCDALWQGTKEKLNLPFDKR